MEKMTTVKLPDGRSLEFPLLAGSMGPQVIDIRTLYAESGMFTYDPGYLSTASCSSAITFIDGAAGVLPRRARYQQFAAPHHLGVPADREDADHRRHVAQVLGGAAVHLPAQ